MLSNHILMAGGLAIALLTGPATATTPEERLLDSVEQIEDQLGARVGFVLREVGSDWAIGHRTDERFPMASTFKTMLCGAVLERAEAGDLDLEERLEVGAQDILDYAPVTETAVGGTMSVAELCLATVDMSDNTAANLLLDRIGGPKAVTTFLRGIGDPVSRLDRREPELNEFTPGDPRDTTTPAAMAQTLEAMLLGQALSPASRDQLHTWMSLGGVTGTLLRAAAPEGWRIADKSGAGDFSRNIVGMVTPPGGPNYVVALFLSEAEVDFATRNAAVAELSAAMIEVLESRE